MTGEPRKAAVTAVRPLVLLNVKKETMSAIFAENQTFHDEMAQVLAERQLGLLDMETVTAQGQQQVDSLAAKLREAIFDFFN